MLQEEYIIRKAKLKEVDILQEIMLQSLAFWGYSEEIMRILAVNLKITKEFVRKSIIYLAEKDGIIDGFFGVVPEAEDRNEAKFYLRPKIIKQGLGSRLWDRVIADLRKAGLKYFTFVIDNNAIGFYEKKGAIKIGERPSSVVGENIPLMRFDLKNN